MKRRRFFFYYTLLLKRAYDISRVRKRVHRGSSSPAAVRKRSWKEAVSSTLNYARENWSIYNMSEQNTHFRETSQFAAARADPISSNCRRRSREEPREPICVVFSWILLTFRGNNEIGSKSFNSRWSLFEKKKKKTRH